MNISLYIAKRYLFSKSSNNAINIMTLIASGGVIVASAALFIVLSVFSGLKDFSLQFSSFVDPDLKLLPSEGKSFMWTDADNLKLLQIEGISNLSKNIEERVVLRSENKNTLATLKGVDQNYQSVVYIDSMVTSGNWIRPRSNDVVSGWGISNDLSFGVFDFMAPLTIYVPKPGKGQITSAKSVYNSSVVTNVGLFEINEELNNEYVFSDISLARRLVGFDTNEFSAIELKLNAGADESEIREQINTAFGGKFVIKNREQLNDALFKMLNTENLAIYLIFTLVIIIALFNVIGAIIMMILDKKASLNTLFNLGAETTSIKRVFFLQGSLMVVLSGIVGLLLGLLIVWVQQMFEPIMLTASLAYPVKIEIINLIIVLFTIVLLGIIASKIASQRITKDLIKT
ncbi:ABC transporter permease [Winogradskyella maritima]|uniref:ABC transporter permease n=1 Tax=Winogradskyella maritima TaxID=1517766 RepID=A0ABV8AGV7_9FLAO|nr:ABC transporter permease [Winogradskyella maritima]